MKKEGQDSGCRNGTRLRFMLSGMLGMFLVAGVALAEEFSGNAEAGGAIYETHCLNCHGSRGKGDGPVGVHLKPQPADLTSKTVKQKDPQELLKTIQEGKPQTAMPAWKNELTPQQIRDVLAFILGLGR